MTNEAAVDDGQDVAAAEDELLAALTSELDSLRRLNPFQVLGVGYEAGDAEIRAAFAGLTKRYHPDRFTRYTSQELRGLAAEIFILIRDAYRRLGDEASRAKALQAAAVDRPGGRRRGLLLAPARDDLDDLALGQAARRPQRDAGLLAGRQLARGDAHDRLDVDGGGLTRMPTRELPPIKPRGE